MLADLAVRESDEKAQLDDLSEASGEMLDGVPHFLETGIAGVRPRQKVLGGSQLALATALRRASHAAREGQDPVGEVATRGPYASGLGRMYEKGEKDVLGDIFGVALVRGHSQSRSPDMIAERLDQPRETPAVRAVEVVLKDLVFAFGGRAHECSFTR